MKFQKFLKNKMSFAWDLNAKQNIQMNFPQ